MGLGDPHRSPRNLCRIRDHAGAAIRAKLEQGLELAIQAGKSQADFACLFEILSDATSKPI